MIKKLFLFSCIYFFCLAVSISAEEYKNFGINLAELEFSKGQMGKDTYLKLGADVGKGWEIGIDKNYVRVNSMYEENIFAIRAGTSLLISQRLEDFKMCVFIGPMVENITFPGPSGKLRFKAGVTSNKELYLNGGITLGVAFLQILMEYDQYIGERTQSGVFAGLSIGI